MKTSFIIILVALFMGCSSRGEKPDTVTDQEIIVITDEDQEPAGNPVSNEFTDRLHEIYEGTEHYSVNDLDFLGIGVVNPIDFEFGFMTDTDDRTTIQIGNIETQQLIIPLFNKPDYGIFFMPVISIDDNLFRVKANKTMSVFVKKDEVEFFTWKDLFEKRALSVIVETGYKEKDDQSDAVSLDREDVAFVVEKMEDDWLQVKEEFQDGSFGEKYWVKWREDNRLLAVPVFLM